MLKHIRLISTLGKVNISFPVAFSAFTGYLLYSGIEPLTAWKPVLGVFFLSMASSGLNQLQEQKTDALMKRTSKRPLASGAMSIKEALLWLLGWAATGSLLLFIPGQPLPLLLGWLTVFWYNAIYTPLKKKSAFAVIPGALVGALPPDIGYSAAGGSLLDADILVVAAFFFIAQIPHFWLLTLRYGKEYEQAGLKSLTSLFSDLQIARISLSWILATAFSIFTITAFGITHSRFFLYVIGLFALAMIPLFALRWRFTKNQHYRMDFILLNVFSGSTMLFLCIDRIWGTGIDILFNLV